MVTRKVVKKAGAASTKSAAKKTPAKKVARKPATKRSPTANAIDDASLERARALIAKLAASGEPASVAELTKILRLLEDIATDIHEILVILNTGL